MSLKKVFAITFVFSLNIFSAYAAASKSQYTEPTLVTRSTSTIVTPSFSCPSVPSMQCLKSLQSSLKMDNTKNYIGLKGLFEYGNFSFSQYAPPTVCLYDVANTPWEFTPNSSECGTRGCYSERASTGHYSYKQKTRSTRSSFDFSLRKYGDNYNLSLKIKGHSLSGTNMLHKNKQAVVQIFSGDNCFSGVFTNDYAQTTSATTKFKGKHPERYSIKHEASLGSMTVKNISDIPAKRIRMPIRSGDSFDVKNGRLLYVGMGPDESGTYVDSTFNLVDLNAFESGEDDYEIRSSLTFGKLFYLMRKPVLGNNLLAFHWNTLYTNEVEHYFNYATLESNPLRITHTSSYFSSIDNAREREIAIVRNKIIHAYKLNTWTGGWERIRSFVAIRTDPHNDITQNKILEQPCCGDSSPRYLQSSDKYAFWFGGQQTPGSTMYKNDWWAYNIETDNKVRIFPNKTRSLSRAPLIYKNFDSNVIFLSYTYDGFNVKTAPFSLETGLKIGPEEALTYSLDQDMHQVSNYSDKDYAWLNRNTAYYFHKRSQTFFQLTPFRSANGIATDGTFVGFKKIAKEENESIWSYKVENFLGPCEKAPKGDVNCDGSVTVTDALITLNVAVQAGQSGFEANTPIGDMNCDGSISATDASTILGVATGLSYQECVYPSKG